MLRAQVGNQGCRLLTFCCMLFSSRMPEKAALLIYTFVAHVLQSGERLSMFCEGGDV